MKTTMKILFIFLATAMLTTGTASASEIKQNGALPETGTATEEILSTNNNDNVENILNTDVNSEEQSLDQGQTEVNLPGEENVAGQINEDGSYIDELGQLYVIDFVDEQGQIVYKKAEEPVIEVTEEIDSDDAELSYSEKDLRLLSSLIYSEAGNQSYKGMLGVANVVLNRVKSKVYSHANTVKEVIYDRKWSVQFAVTVKNENTGLSMLDKALKCYDTDKFSGGNPEAERKSMQQAIKAAKAALQGENNIGDYLCFQTVRCASRIKNHYSDYLTIGGHIFYRTR